MLDFEFASLFGLRCVNENSGFEDAAINMMSTGRNFDRLGCESLSELYSATNVTTYKQVDLILQDYMFSSFLI